MLLFRILVIVITVINTSFILMLNFPDIPKEDTIKYLFQEQSTKQLFDDKKFTLMI